MNDTDNGRDGCSTELDGLFAELAELKQQRNELQAALAECRRENLELRKQLGLDS